MKADSKKKRVGRPQSVQPLSPNLVSTWRQIATRSASLTEALETMNSALDMKLTHSRITDWERENKVPSSKVINYMLATVIPVLLLQQNISQSKALEVSSKVRIPGV